jgi:hypothetical protein
VTELNGKRTKKDAPWLKWRTQLYLSDSEHLELGIFPNVDDAARAYDAEVRRRGWAHARPLNFPQPDELAAYPHAGERCDERGLPLSLAPDPPAADRGTSATQDATGHRPPMLSAQKRGKSGFFGVAKRSTTKAALPWQAIMHVNGTNNKYIIGNFAAKEPATRSYDAEIRRRGWTLIKRLNFPDPADDTALPPSSAAAAGAPGPE